ncbi:hypothetical protein NN561_018138 [Cricetulus griseus]
MLIDEYQVKDFGLRSGTPVDTREQKRLMRSELGFSAWTLLPWEATRESSRTPVRASPPLWRTGHWHRRVAPREPLRLRRAELGGPLRENARV